MYFGYTTQTYECEYGDDANYICDIGKFDSNSTIYISDIPAHIDNYFILQLFNDYSISKNQNSVIFKQKKDQIGIEHYYAFIKFDSNEQAVKAISDMNYLKLENVEIRMILANRENINKIIKHEGCIYIENLDPEIVESQLHYAFQDFGEVLFARIPHDYIIDESGEKKRVSRGYGFIQFLNQADAQKAIDELEDAKINGRPFKLMPYGQHKIPIPDETFTNCFISNLPEYFRKNNLFQIFSEFGTPVSSTIFYDEISGKSKQIGLCMMKTHEEALRAIEGLNGRKIGNNVLHCSRAHSNKEKENYFEEMKKKRKQENYERTKGRNLYIKNFDELITDKKFVNIFSKYGEIENAHIERDSDGKSKKFGFVCFKNPEDAKKCIKESVFLYISYKQIYVSYLLTTEQRMKKNTEHLNQSNFIPSLPTAPFPNMPLPTASLPDMPMPTIPNVQDVKQQLRTKIFEMVNEKRTCKFLSRIRDMSDLQAKELISDESLLMRWCGH